MTSFESDSSDELPVELSRRIVEACERFEQAWKSGQPALPEDLVADLTPSKRRRVLAELDHLAAELQSADSASQLPGGGWTNEPTDLARYQISRIVARGGMGQISEALDQELDRLVAFKEILPAGANDPEYRRRFQIEAEITARLEHPGIIPVYNRGRMPDGRLFYTMRLISGQQTGTLQQAVEAFHRAPPSDEAERDIAWRTLLRRVIDVCNTMNYVHSEGVLHRDLKPSNILLGPSGETLVVDWGLARYVHETSALTSESGWDPTGDSPLTVGVGTVGHAAPEQLMGEGSSTTPSSDLYSLGTILYAVLTGQSPFPSTTASTAQPVVERVRSGRFHSPRSLNPDIDPALEAICLKAMARQPKDRYGSVAELANDLERWLAGEPVLAWLEPWSRRLRRWIGRHRTLVTTGALGLVLLTASLAVLTVVTARNRQLLATEAEKLKQALDESRSAKQESDIQRTRAEMEQRHARNNEALAVRAVAEFQKSVADSRELKFSAELNNLRRELLAKPLSFYRELREQLLASESPSIERLTMLREATTQLAALELDVGDTAAAIELYQAAIEVCHRALSGNTVLSDQESLDWRLVKAESHRVRGWAFNKVDRIHDELDEFNSAVSELEALMREYPDQSRLVGLCGLAVGERAHSLARHRRLNDARHEFDRALELLSAACRARPDDPDPRRHLARTHHNYALALRQLRELTAAAEHLQLAEDLFSDLGDNRPQDPQFIQRLAAARFNEGIELSRQANHTGALAAYRLAENSWRQLILRFPSENEYQNGLRLCLRNIIQELGHLQQPFEQLPAWLELASLTRTALARSPDTPELQEQLLEACHLAGHLLQQQGRMSDAQTLYEEALPIAIRLGDERPNSSPWRRQEFDLRAHLGSFEIDQGRLDEARERVTTRFHIIRELGSRPEAAGADRQVYRSVLALQAAIEERLGDQPAADKLWDTLRMAEDQDPDLQRLLRRLTEIANGTPPTDSPELWRLAQAALARRDFPLAAKLYTEALQRDPAEANNRQTRPRYQAARAAIRAAEAESDPGSASARTWRARALGWLREELQAVSRDSERNPGLTSSLTSWLQDPDWASVRSENRRFRLPEDERPEWSRIFTDLERLHSMSP
jgi:serine/threonine protein kinase